MMRTLTFGNI